MVNALFLNDERYRNLIQTAMDGFWLVDMQGNLLAVNATYCQMSGYSEQELLAMSIYDLESSETVAETSAHIQHVIFKGQDRFTSQHRRKNGDLFYVEVSTQYFPDDGGYFVCFLRDITERNKTEESLKQEIQQHEKSQRLLRQSEERYKTLSEASFSAIVIHDKGVILECNQGLVDMTGFTYEELIGMDSFKLIAPSSRDLALHNMKICYEKQYEIEGVRKNGSIYPISIRAKNAEYQERDVRVTECKDITEEKRHEKLQGAQLRLIDYANWHSTQEFLQKFLNEAESLTQSTIGFYHFVDEGKGTLTLQAWSRNTLENFCKAEGDSKHYPISEAGVWTECLNARKPVIHNDYESLPNKKGLPEGHASVVREMVVPVFRKDKAVAILGVGNKASDYSEKDMEDLQTLADMAWEIVVRKQAEQSLIESEERFHKMFKNHDAVMLLIEPITGHIIEANDAAVAFYGYSREEFQALSIHDINPLPKDDVAAARDKALSGKQSCFEFKHQLSTNELRDVEVHVSPVNVNGQTLLFSIIHDISQRKKLMEEQTRSAQLAALGTVAAGVAHEINNPIQGIMNYATLIKTFPDREERIIEMSQRIINESERITRLTKDLLHYSKDNKGAKTLIDVKETIESALSLMATKVRRDGVFLKSDYQENLPQLVVQPQKLQQVIINLVDNANDALRYKPDAEQEKEIHVCTNVIEEQDGPKLVIEVSDNGLGMSDETIKKALEAFYSTKPSSEGTGLGLSIVDDIVKTHNGHIEIESKEGEYCKIKVIIPAVYES